MPNNLACVPMVVQNQSCEPSTIHHDVSKISAVTRGWLSLAVENTLHPKVKHHARDTAPDLGLLHWDAGVPRQEDRAQTVVSGLKPRSLTSIGRNTEISKAETRKVQGVNVCDGT